MSIIDPREREREAHRRRLQAQGPAFQLPEWLQNLPPALWESLTNDPRFGPAAGAPPVVSPLEMQPGSVPSPFGAQATDSQMQGPPLANATAPTLNDQDPAAMAQFASRMGGEFLPPQVTDAQQPPPPQAPPMPPPQGSLFMPPQEQVAGAVPDFSGPAPQQDLGVMASMQAGPFAAAGGPQATPQMAQRSPFDETRSIESYFSDAALAQRLQNAQKYARNDALLAAGSALMGGEDLLGGLGAAGEAMRGPRAELQQKREELPLEYAGQRFGIEGERQRRGFEERQEGRADETLGLAKREDERRQSEEGRTGRQFNTEQALREIAFEREAPGGYNDLMRSLEMEAARTENAQQLQSIQRLKDISANESKRLGLDQMLGLGQLMESTAQANFLNRSEGRQSSGSTAFRNMTAAKKLIELLDSGQLTPEDALADADVQSDPMLVQIVQEWQSQNSVTP